MLSVFNQILAGTVAGVAGIVVGQPFDTVKVRMHTSRVGTYASPLDCAVKVVRLEGFRGFFKGMLPPIMANAPINAVLFAVESAAYKWTETSSLSSWSSDSRRLVAGALSGLSQVFLACPSELVKIQMQIQTDASHTQFTGPWHCARHIFATQGITGLYRGFWWTAVRDAPAFAIYFWTYDAFKTLFRKRNLLHTASLSLQPGHGGSSPLPPLDKVQLSVPQLLFSGGMAGLCSWLFLQPIDVMKSLYQGVLPSTPAHERTVKFLFQENMRQEGPMFLLRGMVPTCLRAFPTSAVIFLVYEFVIHRLE